VQFAVHEVQMDAVFIAAHHRLLRHGDFHLAGRAVSARKIFFHTAAPEALLAS